MNAKNYKPHNTKTEEMNMAANRKPLTFTEWKKAIRADGWFHSANVDRKASHVINSANASRKAGELTEDGFKRAMNWAYTLDHSAAWLAETK